MKLIQWIKYKLDKWVVKRFASVKFNNSKDEYKRLAQIWEMYRQNPLPIIQLKTKEISVKKGKIKHTLIICETSKGKHVFSLGRL